jgi:hypothetical protein
MKASIFVHVRFIQQLLDVFEYPLHFTLAYSLKALSMNLRMKAVIPASILRAVFVFPLHFTLAYSLKVSIVVFDSNPS